MSVSTFTMAKSFTFETKPASKRRSSSNGSSHFRLSESMVRVSLFPHTCRIFLTIAMLHAFFLLYSSHSDTD